MADFSTIEDTLFVPMLGRIYASEHFPHILLDKKALELKAKLPHSIRGQDTQTQYTLMAGAVRSANMDRYIQQFLTQNPGGIIVELGCGLETAHWRSHAPNTLWYEVDLPNVIDYRRSLLGTTDHDRVISADAFSPDWIQQIRCEHPASPILITASGLLYYFERTQVLQLLAMLQPYGPMEFVFDIVNSSGMKRIHKYMKQVGHADAAMYFYVDKGEELARDTGTILLCEEPYYAHTNTHGLKLSTALTMKLSDCFNMVKMIHLRLNPLS